jgi:signal transduction histidine kinase
LLSNAIKYSPMPDRIGPGEVNLALTWDKTHAQLVIQDNGLGIPPEARSRLFEPFYRADNVTNLPGTGLGLAIVQQCVLRQNGRIELVDSDQGARFVVTLPINDREMLF